MLFFTYQKHMRFETTSSTRSETLAPVSVDFSRKTTFSRVAVTFILHVFFCTLFVHVFSYAFFFTCTLL